MYIGALCDVYYETSRHHSVRGNVVRQGRRAPPSVPHVCALAPDVVSAAAASSCMHRCVRPRPLIAAEACPACGCDSTGPAVPNHASQLSIPTNSQIEQQQSMHGTWLQGWKVRLCCLCRNPKPCLLYTSPSPRDRQKSRMPSSA